MTKLEQDIYDQVLSWRNKTNDDLNQTDRIGLEVHCSVVAEVAKNYIEKAFIDGYYALANTDPEEGPEEGPTTGEMLAQKWLKENGVI